MDDSAEYKLVWNDEFELDHLDLRKWSSDGSGCWSGDYKFCLTGELWRFENSVGTLIMKNLTSPTGKRVTPSDASASVVFLFFRLLAMSE